MDILWAAGEPLTVRATLDRLNEHRREPLAYTTVLTVMTRLAQQDVLRRIRAGRGYAYEPLVQDAAALAVRGVIQQHGEAAITHFVKQAQADPKLLARLERLLRHGGEEDE